MPNSPLGSAKPSEDTCMHASSSFVSGTGGAILEGLVQNFWKLEGIGTGTADLITMLNRMGHSLLYTQGEEIETAIAEVAANCSQILPSSCQPNVFGTFCWDNNDLQEETLSGHGTTHCTNGIVIQETVDTCAVRPDVDTLNCNNLNETTSEFL